MSEPIDNSVPPTGLARDTHALIWVRGRDAVEFLDGLVSQSVAGVTAGAVNRSLLLTPQGKMRALLWIIGSDETSVGLITQQATAGVVIEDLTRFRFRVDAELVNDDRPMAAVVGDEAAAALAHAGLPHPESGWQPTDSGLVASIPFIGAGPRRFVVVGDAVAAVAAVAPDLSGEEYEAIRIAAGEPLGTVDFDDGTISHELGPVDDAVDFAKGCYLGQELVARIDSRGRVNRTLRLVTVAGDLALVGAKLVDADREVGIVTSAARRPDGSASIGLALVRREIADGATVSALVADGPVAATVAATHSA